MQGRKIIILLFSLKHKCWLYRVIEIHGSPSRRHKPWKLNVYLILITEWFYSNDIQLTGLIVLEVETCYWNSYLWLVEMQNDATILESSLLQSLVNFYHVIQKSFLGIYSNELKTYIHMKTCTHMFITALFIISKSFYLLEVHFPPLISRTDFHESRFFNASSNIRQLRCPPIGKWIKQLWNIYIMGYHLAMKGSELSYITKEKYAN